MILFPMAVSRGDDEEREMRQFAAGHHDVYLSRFVTLTNITLENPLGRAARRCTTGFMA